MFQLCPLSLTVVLYTLLSYLTLWEEVCFCSCKNRQIIFVFIRRSKLNPSNYHCKVCFSTFKTSQPHVNIDRSKRNYLQTKPGFKSFSLWPHVFTIHVTKYLHMSVHLYHLFILSLRKSKVETVFWDIYRAKAIEVDGVFLWERK